MKKLLYVLILLTSTPSFGQEIEEYSRMWFNTADTTRMDSLIFMTGTSNRIHNSINADREHPLRWDSIPGDYERGIMWDYHFEDLLVKHIDSSKVHIIFNIDNKYSEDENIYWDAIQRDPYIRKMLKKDKGYMFTSFVQYGKTYFFFIITEINGHVRSKIIEFE